MDKPGMNPRMGMDMMKKMMGGGEGDGPLPTPSFRDTVSAIGSCTAGRCQATSSFAH